MNRDAPVAASDIAKAVDARATPRKDGKRIGKHRLPGASGKDKDNGIRFEARLKKRLKRRAGEKAGRKAARRKKK